MSHRVPMILGRGHKLYMSASRQEVVHGREHFGRRLSALHSVLRKVASGLVRCIIAYAAGFQAIRNQYSAERLSKCQIVRLSRMLLYCRENISYYRVSLKDIRIKQIRSPEDMVRIPVLPKETIMRTPFRFLSYRMPACTVYYTSGTTGRPMICFRSQASKTFEDAVAIRRKWNEGIPLHWSRVAKISIGNHHLKSPMSDVVLHKRHIGLRQGVSCVQAFVVSEAEAVFDFRPTILCGTPSALRYFAFECRKRSIKIRPTLVWTHSEMLDSISKEIIAEEFEVPVHEDYGLFEFGVVASSCRFGYGMHINADNFLVEVIDASGKQTYERPGRIVVTALHNFAMPLIRYETGDIGVLSLEECECGSVLPRLKQIQGRAAMSIKTKTTTITPSVLLEHFALTEGPRLFMSLVEQFQFVFQEGKVIVRYVGKKVGVTEAEQIMQAVQDLLETKIQVYFERFDSVDAILNQSSYKHSQVLDQTS